MNWKQLSRSKIFLSILVATIAFGLVGGYLSMTQLGTYDSSRNSLDNAQPLIQIGKKPIDVPPIEIRSPAPPAQIAPEPQQPAQVIPEPPVVPPIGGSKVTLQEASFIGNISGIKVRIPSYIPAPLKLTEIRIETRGPVIQGKRTMEPGDAIILIYSKNPLPAEAKFSDVRESGGLTVIERKNFPSSWERPPNEVEGRVKHVTVKGTTGAYFFGFISLLTWPDKNNDMSFEIGGDLQYFTLEELLKIAESIP